MHINPKDSILDINIIKIRDFLRRSGRSERWRADYASSLLHLSEEQTLSLLTELESIGYIEKDELHYGEQYWRNTVSGNALGNASAAKPYYLYKVTIVVLFGSYLTDAAEVSDVDIALEMTPKEDDIEKHGLNLEKRRNELEEGGKRFNNIAEWAGAAEIEVWNFLKSKSRIISMHVVTEELFKLAGGKVIFDGTQASASP